MNKMRPRSTDMGDDPVELVEAVIADHEPAAAPPVLDADGRAELLRELRLEPPDVRVLRPAFRARPLRRAPREPADRPLRVADAPALLADLVRKLELDGRRRHAEERPGMAHVELAPLEHPADGLRQLEEPQQVDDGHARAADGLRDLRVGHVELLDQALQRARLLERVQVLALDVLDQGHRDRGLVRDVADDGRHDLEARHLRGPPAPLAGDDLVADLAAAVAQRPHDDRLHDALRADRLGELGQGLLAHVDARLVLAALQQVDRQLPERVLGAAGRLAGPAPGRCDLLRRIVRYGGRVRGRRAEQRFGASPETSPLGHFAGTPSLRFSGYAAAGWPAQRHSSREAAGASAPVAASRRLISPASARYASAPREY